MRHKTIASIIAVFVLFCLTVVFGYLGWVQELCVKGAKANPQCRWDAFYGALLAFTGSDHYLTVTNTNLGAARFLGFLTTISTIFVLALVFVAERIRKLRISLRRNHIVLVGLSDFALSYCEVLARQMKCGITVVDSREALEERGERLTEAGKLAVAADLTDMTNLDRVFGWKPAKVVFGSRSSFANIERLLTSNIRRGNPQMFVRVEDESMAGDLSLWSAELANASIISEGKMVASGLVTETALTTLARARGQSQVHVAVIGIGSMGLALIEELALRCHHPALGRTKVSAFDLDSQLQSDRIRLNRPGLFNALELNGPLELDGRACGLAADNDPLLCVEQDCPLTAIVIATGSDETNVAIAMRLRRIQHQTNQLRAPILVRVKGSLSIAPQPIVELTGGITVFGGMHMEFDDIALEDLRETLAGELHKIWGDEVRQSGVEVVEPWDNLNVSQKRASRRAAFSVIELLHSAGFAPPEPGTLAGLRADPAAIDATLADTKLLQKLCETEHDRWIAERASEGWIQSPTNQRDTAKKHHTSMIAYGELTPEEQQKDINNVTAILGECKRRSEAKPGLPKWRKILRVGVVGSVSGDGGQAFERLDEYLAAAGELGKGSLQLEVVTFDTPGFVRSVTTDLLKSWAAQTGRAANVIRHQPEYRELDRGFEVSSQQVVIGDVFSADVTDGALRAKLAYLASTCDVIMLPDGDTDVDSTLAEHAIPTIRLSAETP